MAKETIGAFGPEYNNRKSGPLNEAIAGRFSDGSRYDIHTADGEVVSGHLRPMATDDMVGVQFSSRAKDVRAVPKQKVLRVTGARNSKEHGGREEVWSRPMHPQDGYGRKG
jgi:hypothetical protein